MKFKFKSIKLWIAVIGTVLVIFFDPNNLVKWLIFITPFYYVANTVSKFSPKAKEIAKNGKGGK